jgi:hypothetical protein
MHNKNDSPLHCWKIVDYYSYQWWKWLSIYNQWLSPVTAFWSVQELGTLTDVLLLQKTNDLQLGTMTLDQKKYSSNVQNGWQMNTNDLIVCFFIFLQSEEITTTYYGYELQLSKLYTRRVYNRFKATYKSSTTFFVSEDT